MTVEARPADHHIWPGLPPRGLETEGVEVNVALPAQPDGRGFQQAGKVAAVGLMAIEAILHDGRVLKNERTSELGVTIKTKFFIGKPLDEMVRGSPVRVVATGTVHFCLAQGMMRKLHLGADLLFMTGSAGILYG